MSQELTYIEDSKVDASVDWKTLDFFKIIEPGTPCNEDDNDSLGWTDEDELYQYIKDVDTGSGSFRHPEEDLFYDLTFLFDDLDDADGPNMVINMHETQTKLDNHVTLLKPAELIKDQFNRDNDIKTLRISDEILTHYNHIHLNLKPEKDSTLKRVKICDNITIIQSKLCEPIIYSKSRQRFKFMKITFNSSVDKAKGGNFIVIIYFDNKEVYLKMNYKNGFIMRVVNLYNFKYRRKVILEGFFLFPSQRYFLLSIISTFKLNLLLNVPVVLRNKVVTRRECLTYKHDGINEVRKEEDELKFALELSAYAKCMEAKMHHLKKKAARNY